MLLEKLERILPRVEKPARYIGGELYSILKNPQEVSTRFGFAFPDMYEIGMSYLGLQIIYHVLNRLDDVYCERIFAPAPDMEAEMREEQLPLFTLETKSPLTDLDIVGFTLQYEMSFTNVINMLDLAGIPFRSSERGEEYPLIAAGGPCAFNPEPLAEIIDFFMLGDGEEVLPAVCEAHKKWKAQSGTKEEFLREICKLKGVYVPRFYEPEYDENGRLAAIRKTYEGAPDKVEKNLIDDLNGNPFPENPIVPLIEIVHDRSVVELFRGCTRGCRFCQAGMIYRPVRERSAWKIKEIAEKQIEATGHEEMSLLSLSTSDYSEIEPLITDLMKMSKEKNVALSLPSLRLDSFSFHVLEQIQGYKKTGLTFAPEAGTQRLRDVINKGITEENIYSAMEQAIALGWTSVKLYFMVGLPTETYEDLDGIVEIAASIMKLAAAQNRKGRFHVTVSVSNFVPKAHTPFQWCAQDTMESFEEKHNYLKNKLKKVKGVAFHYHGMETSHMEAVFARGDRRVCDTLIKAWELGCRFDGWREHFNYDKWQKAFEMTGIDDDYYAFKAGDPLQILPWEHIDCGVSRSFLLSEWEKAQAVQTTKDCRRGCAGCGINSRTTCKKEGTICDM